MPEIIDAYSHLLPTEFLEGMGKLHPTKELEEITRADHLSDVERRMNDMDRFGIDKQVIMLSRVTMWRGIDRDVAIEATRLANTAINRVAEDHPDRFIPVATLPFLDGEFLDELDRCVNDLEMAGVQVLSNVEGKPLDSDEFRPFWEAIDEHDVPVWIHPQVHDWYDWIDEYVEHKTFGWPFDTTLAMARLVWSGILEEYDLDVVTHHLGGMVPFYAERIKMFYELRMRFGDVYPRTELPEFDDPREQFRKFYADLAVNASASAIDCGYDFFGADRLLFGIDYPYGPEKGRQKYEKTIAVIEDMAVSDGVKRAIFADNVKELL